MRLLSSAVSLLLLISLVGTASAQDWSSQLFPSPKFDFGTVARGAKTEHLFTFKNPLQSDIVISSVRASCGCTTPSIVTQQVKPGEVGAIRAQFNTLSFVGQRGATITVQITSPQFAEVQLRVDGYVRRDIVFNPGEIDWGTISEGQSASKVIDIAYAGRNDWKITKVSCANPNVKTELIEKQRVGQRVDYQLKLDFLASATAGPINDEIIFETDDQRLSRVPLSMSGQVQSPLTISSEVLFVSDAVKGQSISKTVFLRGTEDFQVTSVQSTDAAVTPEQTEGRSKVHRIPIVIDTTNKQTDFTCDVVIATDMNNLTRTVKVICEFKK
jgi:hypothetical protein